MNLLPILVWISLWAAVLVFGFMIVLYLVLLLMGDKELKDLRRESDADIADVRRAEAEAKDRRAEDLQARKDALASRRGKIESESE